MITHLIAPILLLLVPAVASSIQATEESKTEAQLCSEYGFSEEKYGRLAQFEMSLQRGECNAGSGHGKTAISLIARDAKTGTIVDFYDDKMIDDGNPYRSQLYRNGVFIFGSIERAQVVRFDPELKKFSVVREGVWVEEKEMPPHTVKTLVGPTYSATLKKLDDLSRNECHSVHKVGDRVFLDPELFEEARLLAAHTEADALYKVGKKQDAALLVLRFLGDQGANAYELFGSDEPAECDGESCASVAKQSPELNRIDRILVNFVTQKETRDFPTVNVYARIREWNDIAFYLMQGGFPKPAIKILQWVVAGDPGRSVARKNLSDANAMKASKRVVYSAEKFGRNEQANLEALRKFAEQGGVLAWHYESLEGHPILTKNAPVFHRVSHGPRRCRTSGGDTLLDLALISGQTKVADYLWENGLKSALLDARDLWWSAVRRHQSKSAEWLVAHGIGLGDDGALESIVDADDVEAYKAWAAASPHARAMTAKRMYSFRPPPRIFEYVYENKMISQWHDDGLRPTVLFLFAENFGQIGNRVQKTKEAIASGVPINTLNRDRKSALDFALEADASSKHRSGVAQALRRAGGKTGKDLLAQGRLPQYDESDLEPKALKAFNKAAGNQ